jgi:hypothetical protein
MPETQHGGRRQGSGRKPQGEVAMVTTAFVIRQDQMDWLKQWGNRSEIVRDALDAYISQAPTS